MSILQMSVSAGALVIAIVLIRSVALNRLPKKMFLILWGIALFRLLVPVSIPLPYSVQSAINEVSRTVMPDNLIPSVIENLINTGDNATGITEIPGVAVQITNVVQGQGFNVAPTTAIWLVGMIAALIFFAVIHYKNQRRLRFATAIRDNDFFNEWLAEHQLLRPISIMQSDRIISPLAVGVFKPRIILPKSMCMSNRQLLDYVLTHEYYHIRRFDAVWKMVLLLALCVHWFNPVVWVMFVLASRDLELTCDDMVLRRFGVGIKKDYAKILIGMIEQGGRFAPLYNGFSKNATQERIVSIMKNKKLTLASVILAVVLVSALTVGVLAASAANNNNILTPEVLVTPDRDVDSSLPDGYYDTEVLSGAEDYSWEDGPIEANSMPGILAAVNRNDENRFTPEEWADILEKVENGEILFFETLEEEVAFFHGRPSN